MPSPKVVDIKCTLKKTFCFKNQYRTDKFGSSAASKSSPAIRPGEGEGVAANKNRSSTTSESVPGGRSQEQGDVAADRPSSSTTSEPAPRERPQENIREGVGTLEKALEGVKLNRVARTLEERYENVEELKKLLKAIEAYLDEMRSAEKQTSTSEVLERTEAKTLQPTSRTSSRWQLIEQSSALFGDFITKVFDGFKRTSDYVGKVFDSQSDVVTAVSRVFGHIGQVHWAGLLLSGIAFTISNWQKLGANKEQLIKILGSMYHLGAVVVETVEKTSDEKNVSLSHSISDIVFHSISDIVFFIFDCIEDSTKQIKRNPVSKFLFGHVTKDLLDKFEKDINCRFNELSTALHLVVLDRVDKLHEKLAGVPENRILIIDDKELDKRVHTIGIDGPDGPLSGVQELLNFSETGDQMTKIRAVVIHGMGGIGKSTLGERLYYSILEEEFHKDEACILDMSPPTTVENLHDELLSRFTHRACNPASERVRKQMLINCFKNLKKRVFIFVDNVEKQDSLVRLLPPEIILHLPAGSRLLVTSRDAGVKETLVEKMRIDPCQVVLLEMPLLDEDSAKKLLHYHVQRNPNEKDPVQVIKYEEQVLRACGGLPLALEVIGRYIHHGGGKEEAWDNALEGLNKCISVNGSLDDKLFGVLKFSYDQLDPKHRQVFIDISFCFNHSSWSDLKILYGAKLEALKSLSLIKKEVKDFKTSGLRVTRVAVHSCLLTLSQNIAADLGTHIKIHDSRDSWDFQKVPEVLVLEGGCRGGYQILQAEDLDRNLQSLRILVMTDVKFIGNCQKIPHKLECLYCHHSNVPFRLRNLEKLRIVDISSAVDTEYQIPRGVKRLRLDAPSLEKLRFLSHSTLQELGLMFCPRLQLQFEQDSFDDFKKLVIRPGTHIKTLPTQFIGLQSLSIQNCSTFILPRNPSDLKNLEHLHVSGVQGLEDVPENWSRLEKLTTLTLEDCPSLKKLPKDIGTNLHLLEVKGCPNLEGVPESNHDWIQDKQDHRGNDSEQRTDSREESSRWLKASGNAEELKQNATAAKFMIPLIPARGAFDRLSDLVYELYPDDNPDVEIVFLPGISMTGDNREAHWRTWRRKRDGEECWLQTLLPKTMKELEIKCRILTVSYESLLNDSMEPEDLLANAMIRDLILHPDSVVGQKHGVPVFLVAHGMGGIVIKHFVWTVIKKIEEENDKGIQDKLNTFLTNLKAFVFYSTPTLGSSAMERLAYGIPEGTPDKMLRLVKVLNNEMGNLNQRISRARRRLGIKTFAFFETRKTNQGDYENENVVVVSEASARQDIDVCMALGEDHYGITQADNERSPSIDLLAQRVFDIVNQ